MKKTEIHYMPSEEVIDCITDRPVISTYWSVQQLRDDFRDSDSESEKYMSGTEELSNT